VTFASEFFGDAILHDIVAVKPAGDPGRPLVLHMDNASPHRVRLTTRNLERKSNYSESSSNTLTGPCALRFFLFGAMKGQLSGHIFESLDELVEARHEIASAIRRMTLERVFLESKERLQRCIDITDACVD
jgi:hypothetical protein